MVASCRLVPGVACFLVLTTARGHVLGIDTASPLSANQWDCLHASNVTWAILRAWHSYGAFDSTALVNIERASAAGLALPDVYLFPCRGKAAQEQASGLVEALGGAHYGLVWLDIEYNPSHGCGWDAFDQASNCAYVAHLANNLTALGVGVGVYTSRVEWANYTVGSGCTSAGSLPLWYAHFDSRAACDDFSNFGGWTSPFAKQFTDKASSTISHCGVSVDTSVGCLATSVAERT